MPGSKLSYPQDLHFASASALSRLLRSRRIGCLELLETAIRRIEALDGSVNAVVVRDFAVARESARRLDTKLRESIPRKRTKPSSCCCGQQPPPA